MIKYVYEGPVMIHDDKVACDKWHGETMAPSKYKAESNLACQFRKQNNLVSNTPVTFTNKVRHHITQGAKPWNLM